MSVCRAGSIVGIGAAVMDTLVTVPAYPREDTKLRATGVMQSGGGPTATGIVAAAKLGAKAGFIGTLSDDAGGRFLLDDFRKYGVCTDYIDIIPGRSSFTSCIWLSEAAGSRTCVFDRGNLPETTLDDTKRGVIRDAAVLMVDGNDLNAAVEAARIAETVLYDAGGLYPGVERLLAETDVLIPSEEFALRHTGETDAAAAARRLAELYHPRAVVVTCGARGGVLLHDGTATEYQAFKVKVADSNGAGDVFHGAFAAGLTHGLDYASCCLFASAVSALKCTGTGARVSVPDFATTMNFLKGYGYEFNV